LIDPIVSLAFSIHNAKGVYAVLLGSGVSRSAQIPTGWEITLDIIRKVASALNESCEPDPDKWFRQKFTTPPGYSMLLDQLGKTPAERNGFLKPYIEPSAEDRRSVGCFTDPNTRPPIARSASSKSSCRTKRSSRSCVIRHQPPLTAAFTPPRQNGIQR
jgi:hypothetical protein